MRQKWNTNLAREPYIKKAPDTNTGTHMVLSTRERARVFKAFKLKNVRRTAVTVKAMSTMRMLSSIEYLP
jgi:hypothetical protein